MDRTRCRWEKILGRFKKRDLPQVASDLGLELNVGKTKSKKELISLLMDKCLKNGITPSELLKLELSGKPLAIKDIIMIVD